MQQQLGGGASVLSPRPHTQSGINHVALPPFLPGRVVSSWWPSLNRRQQKQRLGFILKGKTAAGPFILAGLYFLNVKIKNLFILKCSSTYVVIFCQKAFSASEFESRRDSVAPSGPIRVRTVGAGTTDCYITGKHTGINTFSLKSSINMTNSLSV